MSMPTNLFFLRFIMGLECRCKCSKNLLFETSGLVFLSLYCAFKKQYFDFFLNTKRLQRVLLPVFMYSRQSWLLYFLLFASSLFHKCSVFLENKNSETRHYTSGHLSRSLSLPEADANWAKGFSFQFEWRTFISISVNRMWLVGSCFKFAWMVSITLYVDTKKMNFAW